MIKNYIKVALNVFRRNPFYTFISLFGISFTLMVLLLSTAFFQNELGANKPLTKKDRLLVIPTMGMKTWKVDVKETIDTTYVNGIVAYDTIKVETPIIGEHTNYSNSGVSLDFAKEKFQKMSSPELVSIFSVAGIETYPRGQRLAFGATYTDDVYWNILDFEFIEGKPYGINEVENQARVIVISEPAAKEYFGQADSYLGKTLVWGTNSFEVVGVTRRVNTSLDGVSSDIFIPYTNMLAESLNYGWGYFGSMTVAILAPNKKSLTAISNELRMIESTTELPVDNFDALEIYEKDISDIYAWGIIGDQSTRSGKKFLAIIFGALFLFLLIPTLNLINLNVTRIMERSAEIGVRKAFGARTKDLMIQFLFENIIITAIGGVIGLALALVAMNALNKAEVFENSYLAINPKIFALSLFLILLFGLTSGLLPAWRMAKTQVAKAIKQSKI